MPWKEIDAMNQRMEFVMKALKAENFRALCAEYGISPKTGYKWLGRLKQHGLGGLAEESRRPKSHALELKEEVVCEIVRLKALRPAWGPKKIRAIYARAHAEVPSESSFKRVLDRAGFVERRRLRKRESSGRLFSARKAAGLHEVWTVDFKGWWYGAPGHRCEPLTVRDEYSRYVLELRALPNAKTETVRACFERLSPSTACPAPSAATTAPRSPAALAFGASRAFRPGGWPSGSTWNATAPAARKTTPRTNAFTSISPAKSKASKRPTSKPSWTNGATNTTTSARTKP